MDFSHVYEMETFYRKSHVLWLDCTDITGTDGYCDEGGVQAIHRKIGPLSPEGLHFMIREIIIMSQNSGWKKSGRILPWRCLIIIRICADHCSGIFCPAAPGS